jgi:hypothetical protein
MPLPPDMVISRRQDIGWAELANGAALLDINSSQLIRLNETAARIWDFLEKPAAVSEVCTQMAAAFRGESEPIRAEVTEFLRLLLDEKLLVSDHSRS